MIEFYQPVAPSPADSLSAALSVFPLPPKKFFFSSWDSGKMLKKVDSMMRAFFW